MVMHVGLFVCMFVGVHVCVWARPCLRVLSVFCTCGWCLSICLSIHISKHFTLINTFQVMKLNVNGIFRTTCTGTKTKPTNMTCPGYGEEKEN